MVPVLSAANKANLRRSCRIHATVPEVQLLQPLVGVTGIFVSGMMMRPEPMAGTSGCSSTDSILFFQPIRPVEALFRSLKTKCDGST